MVCGVPAGQETQEPWVEGGEGGVYYLLRSPGELLESSAGSQSIGRMTPALQNKGAMVYFGLRFSLNFWLQRVPLPRLSLWLSQPEIWRSARVIGGEQRPSAVGRMSRPVSPCLWHGSSQSSPCRCSAQRRAAGRPFCVCARARVCARPPVCLCACQWLAWWAHRARPVGSQWFGGRVRGGGWRRGASRTFPHVPPAAAAVCAAGCAASPFAVRETVAALCVPRGVFASCAHTGAGKRLRFPGTRSLLATGSWGTPAQGFCGP